MLKKMILFSAILLNCRSASAIPRLVEKATFELRQSPGIEIVEEGGRITAIQPPSSTTQSRELLRQPKSNSRYNQVEKPLNQQKLVVATTRIYLEDFKDAWNPSIIQVDDGFLMCFRYSPDQNYQPWLSYIGIVLLDDAFQPISKPELLAPRLKNSKTPSQAEDARIFRYQDRMFLIYNDNVDIVDDYNVDVVAVDDV